MIAIVFLIATRLEPQPGASATCTKKRSDPTDYDHTDPTPIETIGRYPSGFD
jgi:hypothetical protein